MSGFFDFVVAFLLLGLAWPPVRARIRAGHPGAEGNDLVRLLNRALALRVGMAAFLNISFAFEAGMELFWGDSAFYDRGAWFQVLSWSGQASAGDFSSAFADSGYGWLNTVSALYYVFGRNQILVQLFNTLLGTLTVLVVYSLARDIFGVGVAQRAARFMAYFPGMIIWASGMYKDPATLLSISTAMLAVTRLRERFTTAWLLLYISAALALLTLRFYVFYFLVIATLGTFVFGQRRGIVANILTNGILIGAFFVTFSAVIGTTTAERQIDMMTDLQDLQRRRADLVQSAGSGFGADINISTPAGALAAIPVGMVHLLFAPFPWAIGGLRQALTVPETLYWYSLMPAFLVGLSVAVRQRFGAAMPMLVFAATLVGAYSVMQGNVGTAYRQRSQVTMFFFILMAVGLEEKEKRRVARRKPPGPSPTLDPRAPHPGTARGPRGWGVPQRPGAAVVPAPADRGAPRPPTSPPRRGA